MKAPALVLAALLLTLRPALADDVDVVVQAGHEGRPQSCLRYHVVHCNLGAGRTERESRWTTLVADAATDALRRAGLRVARRPADYDGTDTARAAVFLHFDGSAPACRSGASVGFPPTADPTFVHDWERAYRAVIPFRFVGENITVHESHYYGFRKVAAGGNTLLIEFGEITCPAQAAWLRPRLHELGERVARFVIGELAK